ncbi:isoprenoid synthase domain-containing protein [Hysterangium stoloniferum]|nr:isoprenoid synthase domain-containing protein [Hysterangium stoloniferum]
MPTLIGPLPRTFRLPRFDETFSVLPDHGENPHCDAVRPKSRTWINQYTPLVCGPKMCAFMDNCGFELIMSATYPYASATGLEAAMDFANFIWLYDEYTDTLSSASSAEAARIVKCTLREPGYDDETWICRALQDFMRKHIDKCGPNVVRRFIDHCCSTTGGMVKEAELRERDEVLRDIPHYVAFRRETSGSRSRFDLVEYCLGIDLPQYVHDDPMFISGYNAAMDLLFWTNDLFSYNMEQAKGHGGANAVTVIMKSKQVDLQTAVDFVGGYCEALTTQLVYAQQTLAARSDPVFSKDAVRVLEGFSDWVKGNDVWSFTTERYFGQQNKMVKETRIVEVRPPFAETVMLKE